MSIKELIYQAKLRTTTQIGDFCRKCYTLTAIEEQILTASNITKITLPLFGMSKEPRLLQVYNHCVDKPWRVLNQYIYLEPTSPFVTLLLVSSIKRKVLAGEALCHIAFIQAEEVLFDLRGAFLNFVFIHFKIVTY